VLASVVSEEMFERVLASERPVIVEFWAPWCSPCLAIAPLLDQIAAERADEVKVVKVNIDEQPGLAARFGISSIPTIVLFEGGVPVAGTVGSGRKTDLEKALGLPPREAPSDVPKSPRLRRLISRAGLRS
jgi:thioredoxin 1